MILAAISAEVVEPEPFCDAVEPALFGDLVVGVVLRRTRMHSLQLVECRAANGGVAGAVALDEFLQQIWAFQDNAAARRLLGQRPEIPEKLGLHELLTQRARV